MSDLDAALRNERRTSDALHTELDRLRAENERLTKERDAAYEYQDGLADHANEVECLRARIAELEGAAIAADRAYENGEAQEWGDWCDALGSLMGETAITPRNVADEIKRLKALLYEHGCAMGEQCARIAELKGEIEDRASTEKSLMEWNEALAQKLAAAQQDSERLDWLDFDINEDAFVLIFGEGYRNGPGLRAAIDAARGWKG